MKVAVLGATGATGVRFVKEAISLGHHVVAVVRSPEKLKDIKDERLEVVTGDIFSQESLAACFRGADAIVSCLGFKRSSSVTGYSESIKPIVAAARAVDIQRIVVMTAYYSEVSSAQERNFLVRWLLVPILKPVLINMREMEKYIETNCSDMNYTIVRPPGLNNGASSGKPVKSTLEAYYLDGPSSMPRVDVAKFMIDCLTKQEFYRKAVAIGI